VAVATSDGKIRLWDTHTHKDVRAPLTGHAGTVTSVAFSPDGKMLASGSGDETIRFWNLSECLINRCWPGAWTGGRCVVRLRCKARAP
jgi:WD40 repeat protein